MLDIGSFPSDGLDSEFDGNSQISGETWAVWNKPRGAKLIFFYLLGAGGGGGHGGIGGLALGGGGAGGTSGAYTTLVLPAHHCPDRLYITLGVGGGACSSTSSAVTAAHSAILVTPVYNNTDPSNRLLFARGGVSGLAATDNSSTAGAPAAGPAASAFADNPLAAMGIWQAFAGQGGGSGHPNFTATSLTYPTTGLITSAGTGGGGVSSGSGNGPQRGGLITALTATTVFPGVSAVPPGSFTSASPGWDGHSGYSNPSLLVFSGGTGGSSSGAQSATRGGNGGNGTYGGGAGGGGGCLTGGTRGLGGVGGNGHCWIVVW